MTYQLYPTFLTVCLAEAKVHGLDSPGTIAATMQMKRPGCRPGICTRGLSNRKWPRRWQWSDFLKDCSVHFQELCSDDWFCTERCLVELIHVA